MMALRPRIADVHCSPLRFQPGDRLLVRTTHHLDEEQKRKLARSIRKWADCEIEIFIYCIQDMEIKVDKKAMGLEHRDLIY